MDGLAGNAPGNAPPHQIDRRNAILFRRRREPSLNVPENSTIRQLHERPSAVANARRGQGCEAGAGALSTETKATRGGVCCTRAIALSGDARSARGPAHARQLQRLDASGAALLQCLHTTLAGDKATITRSDYGVGPEGLVSVRDPLILRKRAVF